MKSLITFIVALIVLTGQIVFGQNPVLGTPNLSLTELIVPQYFGGNLAAGNNNAKLPTAVRLKISGLVANTKFKILVGLNGQPENNYGDHIWGTYNYIFGYFYFPGHSSGGSFMPCDPYATLDETALSVMADNNGEASFWALLHGKSSDSRFNPTNPLWISVVVNDVWWAGDTAETYPYIDRVISTSTLTVANINPGVSLGSAYDCSFIEGHSYAPNGKFIFVWDTEDGSGRPVHGYMIENNAINEASSNGSPPAFYTNDIAGQVGRYGLLTLADPTRRIKCIRVYNADGSLFNESFGTWPNNDGTTLNVGQSYVVDESAAPLPVELTSFSTNFSDNQVFLNWKTATEINSASFLIQRKSNSDWESLGSVNASGYSNSPKEYSFRDKTIISGQTYVYRLKLIDNDGSYKYSSESSVRTGLPTSFSLSQNYPNPFNPATVISYSLPKTSLVNIKVYNVLGIEVMTLVNEEKSAGNYSVNFISKDLPSGAYLYQIRAGNFQATKKMLLIK